MRKKYTKWKQEEINQLIILYQHGLKPNEISKIFGNRNNINISQKIKELKLKKQRIEWNKNNINKLKNLISMGISTKEIAKKLNTTVVSINSKCHKLKIKSQTKYKRWTNKEIQILLNNYKKLGNEHCQILLKRDYNSIQRQAVKLEIATFTRKRDFQDDFKEISGAQFNDIIKRAKAAKLELNIDINYLWELYIKQNKRCALSGLILTFKKYRQREHTASLDRIDSKKGYIKDNVQWLHKDVNMIKWKLKEELFLEYILNIYNYRVKPLKEQEVADYSI